MSAHQQSGTPPTAAAEGRRTDTRYWHPFAPMGQVRSREFVLDRAEGVWIWDTEGRRYLDGTAGLWYSNVGHGRPEIADAVHRQLLQLDAYSTFGDFANEPSLALSERLAERAPMPDARVLLGSGGSDAVETAAKLARRYFGEIGQPDRLHFISRTRSYHGMHGFGTSLAGIPSNRSGYGPLLENSSVAEWDSVSALDEEITRVGADRVAAFFVEPVIGAGGVYSPPAGYIEGVAEVCRKHGVLLIVDSVVCAFGRLGTWFGIERWPGVEPDMIIFAKGVTSGYQPLGGVVVGGRVAEPFWSENGPPFRHGATYAGHPAACAAALANLDLLEQDGLLECGREKEEDLTRALAPLASHPMVANVRSGMGLLAAIDLDPALLAHRPGAPGEVASLVRDEGVIVRPLGEALAISPPLTISGEELELLATGIAAGLDRV